jgi:8-oxo-dGTP pyrophosphatase MutT (NUDIX family)
MGCGLRKHSEAASSGIWGRCYKLLASGAMRREFSAGGVLVRRLRGRWMVAAIRPADRNPPVWALPKGLIGRGEGAEETALREVAEETGVEGTLLGKLGDVRYVYTFRGQRIFKVVSFFLLRYRRGRLGDLPPKTAHEVEEVRWLPLDGAPRLLAYRGEREMTERALAQLADL